MVEEKRIVTAWCQVCYDEDGKFTAVDASCGFDQSWSSKGWIVENQVHTYFSCPKHGAVVAMINGTMITKPSEMFKIVEMSKSDRNVNISEKNVNGKRQI